MGGSSGSDLISFWGGWGVFAMFGFGCFFVVVRFRAWPGFLIDQKRREHGLLGSPLIAFSSLVVEDYGFPDLLRDRRISLLSSKVAQNW